VHASIYADVVGSRKLNDPDGLAVTLGETARLLNQAFAPALSRPFVVEFTDELRGALSDPMQAPLCLSVMREWLAPLMVRVGVSVGEPAEDAFAIARRDDRLVHYAGIGRAGELLVNAHCRLLDPIVRRRTEKQWEAIRAMRELADRRRAAERLGITRQSLAERLKAGSWQVTEDADATIAAYLALALGPAA